MATSPIPFDLERAEISIITCDQDKVYSLFGHSALRTNHVESDEDIVVNWGILSITKINSNLDMIL